ncbi:MAG: FecR domain-containing protein [Candidatus Lustribacter sp.]|jgi:hypothetical protein
MRLVIVFVVLLAGLMVVESGSVLDHWVKQLQRVRGTVGYQVHADGSDFTPVAGTSDLPDNLFAVTRAHSAAVLGMPDSSLISLGENTTAFVGPFYDGGSPRLSLALDDGALRFDVRFAPDGTGAYQIVTNNSLTEVRAGAGLVAAVDGVTLVGCLACASGDVTVTASNQQFAPSSGQFVGVSTDGKVTTGIMSSAVLNTFSTVGVPVKAVPN